VGEENWKVYLTKHYNELFGLVSNNFSIMCDYIHDIPQLSPEENAILTADFT
jgi:hypothetical protein